MEMKVTPGVGIGPLTFGLDEDQLRSKLGRPDRVYDDGDTNTRHLIYNTLRVNAWFDMDSHRRLGWIACAHPDLELFGIRPIGRRATEVLDLLRPKLRPQELDVFHSGTFESHSFDLDWVEVQSQYAFVSNICIGNLFDDKDQPMWPQGTDT